MVLAVGDELKIITRPSPTDGSHDSLANIFPVICTNNVEPVPDKGLNEAVIGEGTLAGTRKTSKSSQNNDDTKPLVPFIQVSGDETKHIQHTEKHNSNQSCNILVFSQKFVEQKESLIQTLGALNKDVYSIETGESNNENEFSIGIQETDDINKSLAVTADTEDDNKYVLTTQKYAKMEISSAHSLEPDEKEESSIVTKEPQSVGEDESSLKIQKKILFVGIQETYFKGFFANHDNQDGLYDFSSSVIPESETTNHAASNGEELVITHNLHEYIDIQSMLPPLHIFDMETINKKNLVATKQTESFEKDLNIKLSAKAQSVDDNKSLEGIQEFGNENQSLQEIQEFLDDNRSLEGILEFVDDKRFSERIQESVDDNNFLKGILESVDDKRSSEGIHEFVDDKTSSGEIQEYMDENRSAGGIQESIDDKRCPEKLQESVDGKGSSETEPPHHAVNNGEDLQVVTQNSRICSITKSLESTLQEFDLETTLDKFFCKATPMDSTKKDINKTVVAMEASVNGSGSLGIIQSDETKRSLPQIQDSNNENKKCTTGIQESVADNGSLDVLQDSANKKESSGGFKEPAYKKESSGGIQKSAKKKESSGEIQESANKKESFDHEEGEEGIQKYVDEKGYANGINHSNSHGKGSTERNLQSFNANKVLESRTEFNDSQKYRTHLSLQKVFTIIIAICTAIRTVVGVPIPDSPTTSIPLVYDEKVRLSCQYHGMQNISNLPWTWTRDSKQFLLAWGHHSTANNLKYETSTLENGTRSYFVIKNMSPTDLDRYKCCLQFECRAINLTEDMTESRPGESDFEVVVIIDGEQFSVFVKLESVYPEPVCNFTYGTHLKIKSRKIDIENGLVTKAWNVSSRLNSTTPFLNITCSIGTYQLSKDIQIDVQNNEVGEMKPEEDFILQIILPGSAVMFCGFIVVVYFFIRYKRRHGGQNKRCDGEAGTEMLKKTDNSNPIETETHR